MSVTRLVGLIGYPVGHSRSPAMQQAVFDALSISARYLLWETPPDTLAGRIASLRAPEMLGANVTIPHKTAVVPLLDALASSAKQAGGAVNTIVREQDGTLTGHNTDVTGVLRVLDAHTAGDGKTEQSLLVVGAGGAARAAWVAARERGMALRVAARNPTAAHQALDALGLASAEVLAIDDHEAMTRALAASGVLINATPVGMENPLASPLPAELLAHMPPNALVFDMVYAPPETALLRAAQSLGLRTAGGLEMLLEQGAAAFQLWTGQPAPLAVMRAALGLNAGQAVNDARLRKA
ncbi:MAG TPA: shikimate dehydrogenase [Ktedonobacterales bacterium]|nr:shikimate dehydrogenase [Ktedonobacterales bacterium]